MTPLATTGIQFVACALLILVAGVRLARYGDIIAEKTGMGGTWTGLVLMAAVTSLPELITGVSSIAIFDVPDIAAADAIGSCMFNLAILALLDFRNPAPLSARVHQGHVLSAAFGIVMLGLAVVAVLAGDRAPALGWISVHTLLFFLLYGLAMRTIFVFERTRMTELAETLTGEIRHQESTLGRAIALYGLNAVVLVGAAAYLPGVGERFADLSGIGQSFVGTVLVAGSTSLPEIVVSVAAARIGALDMAVANLFGSNLFNLLVLGVDDVVYVRGSFLAAVEPVHVVTLTTAMMMTAVAIIGLTYRARRKRYRLSWDTLGILALYAVGFALLRLLA